MPRDSVPIGDLVQALCERFGVEYTSTTQIEIRPTSLKVTTLSRNVDGRFHVDADGSVVSQTTEWAVTT